MNMIAANIATLSGASIIFIFGVAYIYKSLSTKNHCDITRKNLEKLNPNDRIFLFALMKGVAGGSLALAVTIIYLQIQYFKQLYSWIPLIILVSCSIFFLTSLQAMIVVKRQTTIKPPIMLLLLAMLLISTGYFFNKILPELE